MVEFGGMMFDLPDGWLDITADLPPGSPPTLARQDGVGAMQFSVARYANGGSPEIDISSLDNLFDDYCARQGLRPDKRHPADARCMVVSGVHSRPTELTAISYISDGWSVALVSYCAGGELTDAIDEELADTMKIVHSATFARKD